MAHETVIASNQYQRDAFGALCCTAQMSSFGKRMILKDCRLGTSMPRVGNNKLGVDSSQLLQFSSTIDAIYHAALEPAVWPTAVEQIANLHGSSHAVLLTPATAPKDGGFIIPYQISESFLQMWGTKYVQHDPWVPAAIAKDMYRDGCVMTSDDLIPREQLEKSVFYREFYAPMGMKYICTGVVFGIDTQDALPTNCALMNGPNCVDFGDHEKRLLALTLTHLSRALGTMFRLRDAEFRLATNIAALNRLSTGVMLFGPRGNLVFANASALGKIGAGDGLRLRSGNGARDGLGWIECVDRFAEAQLTKEIADAVAMHPFPDSLFSTGVAIPRQPTKRPYVIRLSSLLPENQFSIREKRACAIGFLNDLNEIPTLDPRMLKRVFGLTPAEARLAQEITSGETLPHIAHRMSLSENTMKSQLAAVFAKTGTHRQAELVQLLAGLSSNQ